MQAQELIEIDQTAAAGFADSVFPMQDTIPAALRPMKSRLPSGRFFEKRSEVMKSHFQRFNIMKSDYRNPQIPPAPGASGIRFSRNRRGVLFMVAGLSWSAKRDNRVE
jgi:hypothetical protein